jgi:CRISPR system Cascade subunit CasA
VDAAAQAKQGAVALANLAGDLDRAAGGEGRARERTFELGYSVLDSPFRSWVRSLRNPEQIPEARAQWARAASRLLLNAGDNLIADAGRPALVGKWVKDKLLDAGQAHRWFVSAIAKAFPDATTVNREVTP